jgi:hypothetical protein
LLLVAILAACRVSFFPSIAAAAFLPVFLRGTLWFVQGQQPLDVHRLGFTELGHALLFGVLLCTAFLV